jgi:hypothetical protein
MVKKTICFILCLLFVSYNLYSQFYVAPDGNDANSGTIELPFGTFPKAISEAMPGDTIYARGGVYEIASTITITATKNGTPTQFYTLTAYNDEVPVLDFSTQPFGSKGISLRANYWHIRGLQITEAGDNGMEINFGSNNIIEQCQFYRNNDSGLQLSNGSANNQIINCDSYYNADSSDYADADGFAPKLTVGSGNYFYGCRAWVNCDDGWDGYLREADDVTTTLENCWTWGNGYLENGTDPGPQANGNGFKMGGGDNSNGDSLMHHFVLINCIAFNNKNKGFDQNNNMGSMTLFNCSGYHNLTANYRIQRMLNPGQILMVKNCVSFEGLVQLGSFAVQETNSWLPPFVVTADDFLSLAIDLASAPRQADGSLPEIEFLHLAEGSDLIDAGVDLGYPYYGLAPDLGAFESNFVTAIRNDIALENFQLFQNYPNPFNPNTRISWQLACQSGRHSLTGQATGQAVGGQVKLSIFNLLGQEIRTLINESQDSGYHSVLWDGRDKTGRLVSTGVYFYRLELDSRIVSTKKMLFSK